LLLIILFFLTLFFLAGSFFLTAFISAIRCLNRREAREEFIALKGLFFYRPFHLFFFPEKEYEGIFFGSIVAQNLCRFCFAAASVFFLSQTKTFQDIFFSPRPEEPIEFSIFWVILNFLGFTILSFIVGDYIPRIFGTIVPKSALYLASPITSIFLFLVFPFNYVFLKLSLSLTRILHVDHLHLPATQAKQEILDIIEEASFGPTLDSHDKKLVGAVLSFKERTAREVMVPRVELFSLSCDLSIKEAAKLLQKEGFSRTPVYRENLDNIIGVLMYKDLLAKYMEYEKKGNDSKILEAPIETIQKSVLYAPETKKLSSLLQEFRKKQVHLAIVVDEYGGTEGVVTIEDILEEIVGDISDEYDKEEELYKILPNGAFIVDARMNISDIEEQLKISIPEEPAYDTLGGFIYQLTGTIPAKGFTIHYDDVEIEILSSNEKSVEKVKISPFSSKN
jgi:putative hemolysin